jgi:hypothetical protein
MALPSLTFDGRLPGVACAPAAPTPASPVRLDVAGFVGIAERGPLDTPVAVEDVNQYSAVFGGDVLLAQDDGAPVYAHLSSAVRGFFDNGGRRCHVVRVAEGAVTARFALTGVRAWRADGGDEGEVEIEAAWPGAWANRLRVGTTLRVQPLKADPYDSATRRLPISRASAAFVRAGDVLRLDGPGGDAMYAVVGEVVFAAGGPVVMVAAAVPLSLGAGEHGDMDVVSATHVRFDIDVWETGDDAGRGRVERWEDLAYGHGWLDVLQPPGTQTPDVSGRRSLRLRGPAGDGLVFIPASLTGSAPAPPTEPGADGLDGFAPVAAFLDPALRELGGVELLNEIDRLTVLASGPPARLRGIHALARVDEVAMIAAPDAVHRRWDRPAPPPPEPAPEPPVEPPRDWSHFDPCARPPTPEPVPVPPPPAPTLADVPLLEPAAAFDPAPLHHVQLALVRLCAARGDAVAVLSLPAHYDATAAVEWQQQLPIDGSMSYAAAWHPWLMLREDLRIVPPEGHVAGTVAARELAAGAWAAPANIGIRGVVGLEPEFTTGDVIRLFDAHLNPLARQPKRFTAISAHTLSPDPQWLQLSVRRLLILLRKVAFVLGDRWVFETNNDAFRARVRTAFERLLARLQARGALVAFMVTTAEGQAARIDADNGRFIVELRVAPSSPIEFITVSLVRDREGILELVEA